MIQFPICTHIKEISISKLLFQNIYWFTPHKGVTCQGKGFDLHMTLWCTGRGQATMSYDPAWNLCGSEGMALTTSYKPCTHSRVSGRGAVKVTATHPFQGNPCHCLEGNVPLLLHLSSLLLFERQEISCTLPFQHCNKSCSIGQSTHIPLQAGRFNSPLLTSLICSLTGYVASSHFFCYELGKS